MHNKSRLAIAALLIVLLANSGCGQSGADKSAQRDMSATKPPTRSTALPPSSNESSAPAEASVPREASSCEGTARAWLKAVQDNNCRKAERFLHPDRVADYPRWCDELEVLYIGEFDTSVVDNGCHVRCSGSFRYAGEEENLNIWIFKVGDGYLIRSFD